MNPKSQASPFDKMRNVSFRKPMPRMRTPSLIRTLSQSSSLSNSTPHTSESPEHLSHLSTGINIHDPFVQIKGTYSSLHSPSLPPHSLPSHRIRLWLCRHMHDLGSPSTSLVSLLVGRRMGLFLVSMVLHILSSTTIPRIYILFSLYVQIASVFMNVDNPLDLSRPNRIAAYYIMY
jgi:hypothetical protein